MMDAVQRRRGWIVLSLGFVCAFALLSFVTVSVGRGWHAATTGGNECQVGFQPLPYESNGYVEFFLKKEELAEPLFEGAYFINLTQEYGRNPIRLKVMTSGGRGYGNSVAAVNLNWDDLAQSVWMNDAEKMNFIEQSGSHRNFPFDSASFKFTFKTDPVVNIPVFRFNNRVDGFNMPCEDVGVQRSVDGSFVISFDLRRDFLTRVAAVILFGSAVIFAFSITLFVETKALPTAVASYFFSLWSIRGIFGVGAEGFPTLLDVGILALCELILLLLAIRILFRRFRALRDISGGSPLELKS